MVKKKEKPELNAKEASIISILHKRGGAMSANEISEVTGISYVTVAKYLNKLSKMGVIEEIKIKNGKTKKVKS
ncbi:MAG: winged helix-turn-helix domain-containing protein [Nanoarchaeota archaeon]